MVANIFMVLFIFVFFGVSVYSVVFFLLTPYSRMKQAHPTIRWVWWYGLGFAIMVVLAMFGAMVVWIAIHIGGVSHGIH